MTHYTDDPAANAAAIMADTRRRMTNDALNYAGAAETAFLKLVAYIAGLRDAIALGTLDAAALEAARRQLRDLRQAAEALGVNLP